MATYERINWEDSPSTLTPINAENLNIMDAGLSALVDEFNGYVDGENERIAELNEIKSQLEARIDALCAVPDIEQVREYVETQAYQNPITIIDSEDIDVPQFTLSINSCYMIAESVNLNMKFTNVTATVGTTVVLCTLPTSARPSGERSISAYTAISAATTQILEGWIRSTGEVCIAARIAALTGVQVRVTGSYVK